MQWLSFLVFFFCSVAPSECVATQGFFPEWIDSSLMKENTAMLAQGIHKFHKASCLRASSYGWRALESHVAFDHLEQIYYRLIEKQGIQIRLFDKVTHLQSTGASKSDLESAKTAYTSSCVTNYTELPSIIFDEARHRMLLCDSLHAQNAEFCSDTTASLPFIIEKVEKEEQRRCAFYHSRLKNSEYGFSEKTAHMLESLKHPAAVPVVLEIGTQLHRFVLHQRNTLASDFFLRLESNYGLKRIRIRTSDGKVKDSKQAITCGMRIGILYLIAHDPQSGQLHLLGDQ